MKIAAAIVVSALIVAVAFVVANRYSMATDTQQQVVWRLDRITGTLIACGIGPKGTAACLQMPPARPANSN